MEQRRFSELLAELPCADQLTGVRGCARALTAAGGVEILQYAYRTDDGLYLAEQTEEDTWELLGEDGLHESVRDLAVLLGDSPLHRISFSASLPPSEAVCLLALMDRYILAARQRAARIEENASTSVKAIAADLRTPPQSGLQAILRTCCMNIGADAEDGLRALAERGLCGIEKDEYLLNDTLGELAAGFAMPCAVVTFTLWINQGGYAGAVPFVAVQGSPLDILLIGMSGEEILLKSVSAEGLLDFLENALRVPVDPLAGDGSSVTLEINICPGCGAVIEDGARFCKQCGRPTDAVTEGAPKAAASPEAASSWRCECGRVGDGAFCPVCGARRP